MGVKPLNADTEDLDMRRSPNAPRACHRRAFAAPPAKLILAGIVAVAAVGAAGLSYVNSRSQRDFTKRTSFDPGPREGTPAPASDPASSESSVTPTVFTSSGSAEEVQHNVAAIAQHVAGLSSIVSTAGAVLASEKGTFAERAALALTPLLSGTPESFADMLSTLGVEVPATSTGEKATAQGSQVARTAPFSDVLAGAELDLENIRVGPPEDPGGMGGQPAPGSGAYRAKLDEDGNPVRDPNAPVLAVSDGTKSPAPTETRRDYRANMIAMIGGMPGQKTAPRVEVLIPGRLKGSTSLTPEFDVGVIMAKGEAGAWMPSGYSIRVRDPEVMKKLMNGVRRRGG